MQQLIIHSGILTIFKRKHAWRNTHKMPQTPPKYQQEQLNNYTNLQIRPFILHINNNLLNEITLVKELLQLTSHDYTTCVISMIKQLDSYVFGLPIVWNKIQNDNKHIMCPFDFQRSKVEAAKMHVINVGCTYSTKSFCINANRMSLKKTSRMGTPPLGIIYMLVDVMKWIPYPI